MLPCHIAQSWLSLYRVFPWSLQDTGWIITILFPRQSELGHLVACKKIINTNLSGNISAFFPRPVKFSINSKHSEAFTSFKYFFFSNYLQIGIPFPFHSFLAAFGLQLK